MSLSGVKFVFKLTKLETTANVEIQHSFKVHNTKAECFAQDINHREEELCGWGQDNHFQPMYHSYLQRLILIIRIGVVGSLWMPISAIMDSERCDQHDQRDHRN